MEKTYTLLHLDVFYRDILLIWGNEEQTRQVLAVFHDEDEINELMESINFTGGKGERNAQYRHSGMRVSRHAEKIREKIFCNQIDLFIFVLELEWICNNKTLIYE